MVPLIKPSSVSVFRAGGSRRRRGRSSRGGAGAPAHLSPVTIIGRNPRVVGGSRRRKHRKHTRRTGGGVEFLNKNTN